jgi:hypothetical protein
MAIAKSGARGAVPHVHPHTEIKGKNVLDKGSSGMLIVSQTINNQEFHMPSTNNHTASLLTLQAAIAENDLWRSELVPLLPAELELHAQTLGAFSRARGLASPLALLRGLLYYALFAASFQTLATWAVLAGLADISDSAWHKRLIRSIPWLKWLLAELLAFEPQPSFRLGRHGLYRLLLVDATTLAQPGGTGDDWRLHCAFDFLRGRLAQFELTDRSTGEHLGHYHLQPNDIVVADNGYGYRSSVATVRKQQAHLLIRIRPATFPLQQMDGSKLDIVAQLRKRGPNVREWSGWCEEAGERYWVRVVAGKLTPQQAAAARKRARRSAQKHGRKVQEQTLLVAGWVLLVSTLSEQEWSAEELLQLYRVRWQVELLFKRMKSVLGLGGIRGTSRESIEAVITAQMVGWALCEGEMAGLKRQMQERIEQEERVVSAWGLKQISVDVLRQQVRGGWGAARLEACMERLQRHLSNRVRTDRQEQERAVRQWLERRPRTKYVVLDMAA